MLHAVAYWLGLTDAAGVPYLWWSGFAGDLTIFAGAVVFLRHHNCHELRCWRLGHVNPDGVVQCRRHRSSTFKKEP